MASRWLVVAAPAAGMLAAVVGVVALRALVPKASGAPVPATVETLDPKVAPYVRVDGVAHYDSLLVQPVAGGLVKGDLSYQVFGFFPDGDLSGRAVPVIVRTQRVPECGVSFEHLTIEGLVGPLDRRLPHGLDATLRDRTGYGLADGALLLEPLRIVSEDGVWIEP